MLVVSWVSTMYYRRNWEIIWNITNWVISIWSLVEVEWTLITIDWLTIFYTNYFWCYLVSPPDTPVWVNFIILQQPSCTVRTEDRMKQIKNTHISWRGESVQYALNLHHTCSTESYLWVRNHINKIFTSFNIFNTLDTVIGWNTRWPFMLIWTFMLHCHNVS